MLPDPDRLCAYLRRSHPSNTAQWVESLSGVPAGTVEKWLCGKSKPGFFHFGALISAYGPNFLAAVYPSAPRWLDEAVRDEEQRELERQRDEINARLEAMRQAR